MLSIALKIVNIENIFTLSSSASINMGMLARLSQATYLLGHVLRHTSDKTMDTAFHQEEKTQLTRTIRSLIELSYVEGNIRRMTVCAQTSICYAALILLHDPSSTRIDHDHIQYAMAILKPVAAGTAFRQSMFLTDVTTSVENASPLLMHWAYQAATIYSRFVRETGIEELGPTENFKVKLRIMSQRWMAAGMFGVFSLLFG